MMISYIILLMKIEDLIFDVIDITININIIFFLMSNNFCLNFVWKINIYSNNKLNYKYL